MKSKSYIHLLWSLTANPLLRELMLSDNMTGETRPEHRIEENYLAERLSTCQADLYPGTHH